MLLTIRNHIELSSKYQDWKMESSGFPFFLPLMVNILVIVIICYDKLIKA